MLRFLIALLLSLAGLAAVPSSATAQPGFKMPGATGGILRFPNTNQDEDEGNAFAEAWLKQGILLWQEGDIKVQAFYLGNFVRDTEPNPWNNSVKHGLGLQLSTRVGKHLELTFSGRHDWYSERDTDNTLSGWRFAVDYYYYRHFPAETDLKVGPLDYTSSIFKSYGTLAYPGSLEEDDTNIVLTAGGEYSWEFQVGERDLLAVPFVDLHLSWDRDSNNYNNKAIPAVGVKLRKPIHYGELFGGVKFEADYRWVDETLDTGPMLFAGWYKGW